MNKSQAADLILSIDPIAYHLSIAPIPARFGQVELSFTHTPTGLRFLVPSPRAWADLRPLIVRLDAAMCASFGHNHHLNSWYSERTPLGDRHIGTCRSCGLQAHVVSWQDGIGGLVPAFDCTQFDAVPGLAPR